ncbi:MAG TPA: phosphate ABC transporter substrate-binding protein PstS [Kineosporiaceae bacterium]|nr:phosphate ABC transporter substrate-binding protein PstS [Kineosporiaceae bacterium]
MKLSRTLRLGGVAIAGALALAACGSDNNTSSSTTSAGAGGGSSASGSIQCASGTINASGSTAQANAMTQWIKDFQTACSSASINYNAVGSGQGISDFVNAQTAFAGSDSPLNKDKGEVDKANARCKTGQAVNLPMVPGPIAVVYNLQGVSGLTMTPSVLSQIFSGKITKWNDPAIAKINSGVTLPSAGIATIHRSDSSGTTDNFTKYLTAAGGSDWTYDHDKQWKAPGGQGAKGSDGVSLAVKQTPNSIAYVEFSYAQQNSLGVAKIDNGGGAVELTAESVSKGIASAKVVGTGDDLALSLDYATKNPGAYPIVLVTYEITCIKGLPADQAGLVKAFLTYTSSSDGQGKLTGLGYAPLPTEIQQKVQASVAKIS